MTKAGPHESKILRNLSGTEVSWNDGVLGVMLELDRLPWASAEDAGRFLTTEDAGRFLTGAGEAICAGAQIRFGGEFDKPKRPIPKK